MATQSFYLKYRPQTVSELDIVSVRTSLTDILKSPNLPHAFLFSGPRGAGKTSAARILAKAINCETNDRAKIISRKPFSSTGRLASGQALSHFEPCNKCSSCTAITQGSSLDIIEIDAASNRGVDDIRLLREGVKLASASSRYKVYIVDEAHMLTTEAANALLKTLEEPPHHVVFVLATTAPDKLSDTIRSRCHQINFPKATPEEVERALNRVVKGEHLKFKADILTEIASRVDGSLRDAHKLMERLVLTGKTPTQATIKAIFGQAEGGGPEKLIHLLRGKRTLEGIAELGRLDKLGVDWNTFAKDLLETLRSQLLDSLKTSTSDTRELRQLIELISTAALEIPKSTIPQLSLELAVVDWCTNGSESDGKGNGNPSGPKTNGNPQSHSSGSQNDSRKLADIQTKWDEILKAVKPYNHSLEALLRAAHPVQATKDNVTLEVFYRFHKEQLEQEKCRRVVEQVITTIIGKPIKLFYRLGEKPKLTSTNGHPQNPEPVLEEVNDDAIWRLAQEVFTSN